MLKKPNKVNVIVPFKNVENYVEEFLGSINSITSKNFQLILVNDHSDDHSEEVLSAKLFGKNNVLLIDSKGVGVSSARNTGLSFLYSNTKSNGEWVAFLDFDDKISGNLFNYIQNYSLQKFDYIAFGYTTHESEMTSNKIQVQNTKMKVKDLIVQAIQGSFKKEGTLFNFNSPWSKLYSLDFLRQNDLYFDEELSFREDLLFNIQVLSLNPTVGLIENTFYFYRLNNNSVVHSFIKNCIDQNTRLYGNASRVIARIGLSDEANLNLKNTLWVKISVQSLFVFVFPSHGTDLTYRRTKARYKELLKFISGRRIKLHRLRLTKKESILFSLLRYNCFWLIYFLMLVRRTHKKIEN